MPPLSLLKEKPRQDGRGEVRSVEPIVVAPTKRPGEAARNLTQSSPETTESDADHKNGGNRSRTPSFVKIGAAVMPVLSIFIRTIRKGGRLGGEGHDDRERDASQDDLHRWSPQFAAEIIRQARHSFCDI